MKTKISSKSFINPTARKKRKKENGRNNNTNIIIYNKYKWAK